MPITNPIKRKEYARLSMAIKKAQERGEDISHLLEQRKSLTQQGINDKQFIPKKKYKQNSLEVLLNEITKTQALINQEKTERWLFQAEIRQGVKEIKEQLANSNKLTRKNPLILSAESQAQLTRLTVGLKK